MNTDRFPMQNGPKIDRQTAEEIYVVYSCLYGKDQSLDRIGERGGFGWAEVPIFFREHQSQKARGLCRCPRA